MNKIISLVQVFEDQGMETITNPSLSRLCRKNPNKGVFGWFKSSFEG